MSKKSNLALSALAFAIAISGESSFAADVRPLPANAPVEKTTGQLEQVFAFHNAMPTGVTVTETGRIFVNYPKWGDDVKFTVAEIRNGKEVAYPDAAFNRENHKDPAKGLISVQSVVADGKGRVWLLDTVAPSFSTPKKG